MKCIVRNNFVAVVLLYVCSQNKLDEALISSGRFADAVQSLMEWLNKSDAYLAEDQPILGDLDTVTSLIDQHRVRAVSCHCDCVLDGAV